MDGYSRNVIRRRLDQVYSALIVGAHVPSAKFGSLRDLLAQEHDYGSSTSFEEDRRYFAALLADLPQRVSLSRLTPSVPQPDGRGTLRYSRS